MTMTLRNLEIGDAGWLIGAHGMAYARDEGFDASFEALVARILADFIESHDPALERGWIAVAPDGARLGSIFCVQEGTPGVAKLRLFYVDRAARGQGLGKLLLLECMNWARAKGYRQMRLWTHESHRAACALYAAQGWRCIASTPVRSFGTDLVEQSWEIDL